MNWYLERSESQGATAPNSLYPTPGVESFVETTAIGGRAMFATGDRGHISGSLERCFGVQGASLIEVFTDGTYLVRGTLATDANPATICSNGDGGGQLFITSGDKGYCYDLTTDTLTEELSSGATQGGMLYGYFVAFDVATSTIRISDLFDGTTWDPTQFAQRTIGADPWQAMWVTPYGQIFLPGSQTGEFWYNSGAFPFPFAPDPSGLIEEGIAATFAVTQAGKSVAWLSTNKNGGYQVMRATGFTPQRISDHALEYAISRYTRVSDCLATTYEDQGHAFLLLTFPSARTTKVYDFATQKWADRGTWISEMMAYEYWRPVFHCFAFNKHLVADRESNVIYHMDISFPLDVDGRVIRRVRRAPAVVNQNTLMTFPLFEVLLEGGLGNQSGIGSDPPLVLMRYSNDGGLTFSNQKQASAGVEGDYGIRLRFLQNGQGRKRVFEVTVSDPVISWRLTEAYLRVLPSRQVA